jgi:diketogulonate reductase-like aldo/keto reductase
LTGSPSLLGHIAITDLAQKKGVEPAQIVFRLAQHWGIVPLAGSQNKQHMKDGVEADKIPLTIEEIPKTVETMVFAD